MAKLPLFWLGGGEVCSLFVLLESRAQTTPKSPTLLAALRANEIPLIDA
jgi:hypothetical protein